MSSVRRPLTAHTTNPVPLVFVSKAPVGTLATGGKLGDIAPTLLEPLVSILLGAALLGEGLGARAVGGGTLILAGAVVVMTARGASTSASSPPMTGSPRR